MSESETPVRPGSAPIRWTGAGVLTSLATLLLMFGLTMVGAGAGDHDPTERAIGIFMGVISLVGWLGLVVISGLILVRGIAGHRATLGAAPALVSIVWFGVAVALILNGVTTSIILFGPLSPIVGFSLITAGALPAAFVLLIANIVLRLKQPRQ